MLGEWLAASSVGIGDRVAIAGSQEAQALVATRALEEGETVLELKAGACPTSPSNLRAGRRRNGRRER